MNWRDKVTVPTKSFELEVEAITCIHGSNFLSAMLCGGVNGYWLKIKRGNYTLDVYVTGDTINHAKMKAHIKGRKADILIPNMGGAGLDKFGGPFSFTADSLKEVVKMVDPAIILPVHHTSFSLFKEPITELYKWNDERVFKFDEGDTVRINSVHTYTWL